MTWITGDLRIPEVPATTDLPPTASEGSLFVVLSPIRLWARSGGGWVQIATPSGTPSEPSPASETVAGVAELATQAETDTGTDDGRIVTPLKLANRTATESRSGLAEIATQAEVDAGTIDTHIVTPAKLSGRVASETLLGIVALATNAQAVGGNNNVRAMTPLRTKEAVTPGAWIAPTLLNSWVDSGAPEEVAGYRKTLWGEVQLRGSIKNGTTTNGTTILTLPAGYRPASTRRFGSVFASSGSCTILVDAAGAVTIYQVTNNAVLSLESVRFDAA